MGLDEKARENLEAAERLLPDDAGREGLLNAAASRAYYAAYLATAHCALRAGATFTDEQAQYFRHDRLPDGARGWRILDDDDSEDLGWLYGLRIKADYLEDQIDVEEASGAFDVAKRLVGQTLDEER